MLNVSTLETEGITAGIAVALVALAAAVTVGFGAPRPTAVLAVLGYRIVNFWLPLLPGAVAYLRIRLIPGIHRTHDTNERTT